MRASHATFAKQRTQLLERIAAERGAMTASLKVCRQPLAWVDLGRAVGRFVRAHPFAVAAGYALARLVLPRPLRRVAGWWWLGRQLATVVAKGYGD